MSEAVLQVTNLVKKIKGKTILDHISFEAVSYTHLRAHET